MVFAEENTANTANVPPRAGDENRHDEWQAPLSLPVLHPPHILLTSGTKTDNTAIETDAERETWIDIHLCLSASVSIALCLQPHIRLEI